MDRTFDPFSRLVSDDLSHPYTLFENVRTSCKFHDVGNLRIRPADTSSPHSFDILHLNARSVVNKFDDIQTFLAILDHQWSAVCVSESWLTKDMQHLFNLDAYQPFYRSRTDKSGGGSILYVLKHLHCKEIPVFEFKTAEVIFVKAKLNSSRTCMIMQIYRAPKNEAEFLTELEQCLDILSQYHMLIYIVGDFNMDLFSTIENTYCETFFSLMCSHGFLPTISKATRVTTETCTLLDNIFCNDLAFIQRSGLITSDFSDHFTIFATCDLVVEKPVRTNTPIKCFDYRQINNLNKHLASKLAGVLHETDPEVACNLILDEYKIGIDKYSYILKPSRKSHPIRPWITPGILLSINRKNELFKINLKTPSVENTQRYHVYRNMLTKIIKVSKKRHYENELLKHKGSSKETWKILNTVLGRKSGAKEIPSSFICESGETVENNFAIANGFNNLFANIGPVLQDNITSTNKHPLDYLPNFVGDHMEFRTLNEQDLEAFIISLKNKGAGFDKINAKLFKSTYKSILPVLRHFFNICLNQGVFPKALKIGVVKPVFKGGDDDRFSNYRPISILPVLSKVLEKIIHAQLMAHFRDNNLLCSKQFGFRKAHCTYMPILLVQDLITKAWENNEYVVGIYLDLKKAFDTVDVNVLCQKLEHYGVTDNALKMLTSYLSDRTQTVVINEVSSDFKNICMGVPQGSILGPLLFVIYINDITRISTNCELFLYADDTAIFMRNKDAIALQHTLDTTLPMISEWLNTNLLSLNTKKKLCIKTIAIIELTQILLFK